MFVKQRWLAAAGRRKRRSKGIIFHVSIPVSDYEYKLLRKNVDVLTRCQYPS